MTIPVVVVAYFQFGVTPDFYWVVGAYLLIQVLDGNVLVPLLFSEAVNLHPVAIVIAVLFFGGLWGLWGVFFAIPLATLVNAILSAWPSTDSVAVLHDLTKRSLSMSTSFMDVSTLPWVRLFANIMR